MGRRSGGGSSYRPAPRSSTRSSRPKKVDKAPAPAPVPASGGGSFLGTIATSIVDGLGWGAGTAVAHRAVDSIMGPRVIQVERINSPAAQPEPAADVCGNQSKAFQDCLNKFGSDISRCQVYIDMLSECKRNSGTMTARNSLEW